MSVYAGTEAISDQLHQKSKPNNRNNHFKTKCIVQINTEIGSFLEDYVILIRSLLRLIHELISGLFTHLCEHSSILLYTHRCY